ncbi:hypothetical protein [Streptomyces sp. NPDC020362]
MPALGSAPKPLLALFGIVGDRCSHIHGLHVSRLDGSLVPVVGLIWPLSGQQPGETVHGFRLTGFGGLLKPPLCLAGVAAFPEVSRMHHRPCIAAFSSLLQTEAGSCRELCSNAIEPSRGPDSTRGRHPSYRSPTKGIPRATTTEQLCGSEEPKCQMDIGPPE